MVQERDAAQAPHGRAGAAPIRVLITTLGLDLHDLGARVVGKALSNAGMEVIIGNRLSSEEVARIAVQEDVDVVGLSVLHGAHRHLLPACVKALHEAGRSDALVIAGGAVPAADVADLKARGITEVFRSGASTAEIVAFIQRNVRQRAERAE